MKKRLWIGITATAIVTAAVILGLLFFGGFFLSEEAKAYNRAVDRLKENGAVTLDIVQKSVTEVGGSTAHLTVEQELTYNHLDTKVPSIKLVEKFPDSSLEGTYTEHCIANVSYAMFGDGLFIGTLSEAETEKRYVPVGLLEAKRYRRTTKEADGDGTLIRFTKARSAEAWALPTGAKLVEASGTAKLDKDGALAQMTYVLTYSYGNVKTTLKVDATPRQTAETVELPSDASQYTTLQYINAPRDVAYTTARAAGLRDVSIMESKVFTGGTIPVSSTELYLSEKNGRPIFVIDSTVQESQSTNRYQVQYLDGILTRIPDSISPKSMTDEEVRAVFAKRAAPVTVSPQYWEDVTVTDLGTVLLLEFALGEKWSKAVQEEFRSGYVLHEALETVAYMSIDKKTGVSVGSGYKYEGTCNAVFFQAVRSVTVYKQESQSVEFPAQGAYASITGEQPKEAEPEEKATPLFYRVTGKDGQEMWLLGTIHIGDARTAYLPEEIYDAFADSDALALEIDAEKFEEQLETDAALQEAMAEAYFYDDGSEIEDHLDDEVYELALKYMKASGNYNHNAPYMKTSVWESAIGEFFLQLGHSLSSDKGVEMRLTALAKAQNKPIREVESGQAQIQMLTGWSDELQEMLLASTLEGGPAAYNMSSEMLYELWCTGDEKALRQQVNIAGSTAGMSKAERKAYEEYMEEYDRTMNTDRNAKMVNVAISYLESGETVFYAVGLAHLLDDTNGLVDALRQAGYTVERVRYS